MLPFEKYIYHLSYSAAVNLRAVARKNAKKRLIRENRAGFRWMCGTGQDFGGCADYPINSSNRMNDIGRKLAVIAVGLPCHIRRLTSDIMGENLVFA